MPVDEAVDGRSYEERSPELGVRGALNVLGEGVESLPSLNGDRIWLDRPSL